MERGQVPELSRLGESSGLLIICSGVLILLDFKRTLTKYVSLFVLNVQREMEKLLAFL